MYLLFILKTGLIKENVTLHYVDCPSTRNENFLKFCLINNVKRTQAITKFYYFNIKPPCLCTKTQIVEKLRVLTNLSTGRRGCKFGLLSHYIQLYL